MLESQMPVVWCSTQYQNFRGEEDYLLLEPKNAESDQTTDFGSNWMIKDSVYFVKSKEVSGK